MINIKSTLSFLRDILIGLITGLAVAWASGDLKWVSISYSSFGASLVGFLDTEISFSLWELLLGSVAWFLLLRLIFFIRRTSLESIPSVDQRNPILDDKIGDGTFEELYGLLNNKLRIQTRVMLLGGIPAPEETLLEMFYYTFDEFRSGVPFGEGLRMVRPGSGMDYRLNEEYKINVLAPKLLEYGLFKVVDLNEGLVVGSEEHSIAPCYYISDLGYKFYDDLKIFYPNL